MIIDAHVHLYTNDSCNFYGWRPQRELVDRAYEAGIEKIAVSSLGKSHYIGLPSEEEVRIANDLVIQLMRECRQVYGYCYLNPRNSNCKDELKRCVDVGMIGIKLWIATEASSPLVFPIVEAAIKYRIVILQHCFFRNTGNWVNETSPFDIALLAQRYPEAKIIMAHLNANLPNGVDVVKMLPNVYIDTSGGYMLRTNLEMAISKIGAERILYGSDAPGRSFNVQTANVNSALICQAAKEKILSTNFLRLIHNENH